MGAARVRRVEQAFRVVDRRPSPGPCPRGRARRRAPGRSCTRRSAARRPGRPGRAVVRLASSKAISKRRRRGYRRSPLVAPAACGAGPVSFSICASGRRRELCPSIVKTDRRPGCRRLASRAMLRSSSPIDVPPVPGCERVDVLRLIIRLPRIRFSGSAQAQVGGDVADASAQVLQRLVQPVIFGSAT